MNIVLSMQQNFIEVSVETLVSCLGTPNVFLASVCTIFKVLAKCSFEIKEPLENFQYCKMTNKGARTRDL